jgi:V-type H+-transporting ATPase subunit D
MAVAREMQGATFCISEAVWAAGDFRKHVVEAPQRERSLVRVKVRNDNVAGVKLPVFSLLSSGGKAVELETLGLAGGGRAINAAKDKFTALLELLVKLGSLQTSFVTLDEAIKITNRRVNALDNVRDAITRARALPPPPPTPRSRTRPAPLFLGGDPLLLGHHCVRDLGA